MNDTREEKATCGKCGGNNMYWHEAHPDTGMDEMELRCHDCEAKRPKLPLSFRLREWWTIKWKTWWGHHVVRRLFKIARLSARKGGYRCTWCGSEPGFSSCFVGGKGLRCMGIDSDCTKF